MSRESVVKNPVAAEVFVVLAAERRGLTVRAVRERIGKEYSSLQIEEALHQLRREGRVEQGSGLRWRSMVVAETSSGPSKHRQQVQSTESFPEFAGSRWSDFRRLCLYYAECLRLEASQQVDSYGDRENERFVTLPARDGEKGWSCLGNRGRVAVKIEKDWQPLVRYLARNGRDTAMFLGGPVWVHVGRQRESKEIFRRIYPLFVAPVSWSVTGDQLYLTGTDRWDVNHGWLSERFRRAEQRQEFLAAVGLAQLGDGLDHPFEDAAHPSFNQLFDATFRVYRDWWRETLSDKVIDRSNLLRFGKPSKLLSDHLPAPRTNGKRVPPISYDTWKGWRRRDDQIPQAIVDDVETWIQGLNGAMERVGRPFAFRVHRAIKAYLANYPDQSETGIQRAMADQVEFRILPRLRGVDPQEQAVRQALEHVTRLVADTLGDGHLAEAIKHSREAHPHQFSWLGMDRSLEEAATT